MKPVLLRLISGLQLKAFTTAARRNGHEYRQLESMAAW